MKKFIKILIFTILLVIFILLFFLIVLYLITASDIEKRLDFLINEKRTISLSELKTGDLILFSNTTDPISLTMEMMQSSYVYHIGMVLCINNEILIWESSPSAENDKVQIIPLEKKMKDHHYSDYILIRQLYPPITDFETLAMIIDESSHIEYDSSCIQHGIQRFKTFFQFQNNDTFIPCSIKPPDKLYCSQFIAYIMTKMGYLDQSKLMDDILPLHFTQINQALPFHSSHFLDKEFILI